MESRAYRLLRERFRSLSDLHFMRIENLAGSGCPDINVCYAGRELWIECKEVKRFSKGAKILRRKLRPEQLNWMRLRYAAGGATWICLYFPNRQPRISFIAFHPEIVDYTLEQLMELGYNVKNNWEKVIHDLFRR